MTDGVRGREPARPLQAAGGLRVGTGHDGVCGSGTPLDCTAPTAWMAVSAEPCSLESVLAEWGVDPELTSLLVDVRSMGGRCWAAPSAQARSAGAATIDLQRVSGTSAPPALRACARGTQGKTTVSCLQSHELEWVGGWRAVGTQDPTSVCRALGRRYTNSALADAAGRVESLVVQGQRPDGSLVHRCALTVRGATLGGSLHGVGDGPLPIAKP